MPIARTHLDHQGINLHSQRYLQGIVRHARMQHCGYIFRGYAVRVRSLEQDRFEILLLKSLCLFTGYFINSQVTNRTMMNSCCSISYSYRYHSYEYVNYCRYLSVLVYLLVTCGQSELPWALTQAYGDRRSIGVHPYPVAFKESLQYLYHQAHL